MARRMAPITGRPASVLVAAVMLAAAGVVLGPSQVNYGLHRAAPTASEPSHPCRLRT
jgi:hypothetical protein